MPERVILSIGTKKGVFVAEAPKTRGAFALRGPSGPGVSVYSTLIDTRGKPRIYASSCNAFFGMKVLVSTDLGKTFNETKSAPAFPKDDGRALINIWSLEPGEGKQDLWCGVEPASLFKSNDGGDSWEMVQGISNHEHARKWQPGNGGLCMHTILRDGKRMHVGISTGGHYVSEDGGRTFKASNKGVGAGFLPILALTISSSRAGDSIDAERIATGFDLPLYVCAPPGDTSRLFVAEQHGQIKIINLPSRTVNSTPFLDISFEVGQGQGTGIRGMTFDPNYATNGHFYVSYATDTGGFWNRGVSHIARFTVSADPNFTDPSTEVTVITTDQPAGGFNWNWLGFSPRSGDDGNLYI